MRIVRAALLGLAGLLVAGAVAPAAASGELIVNPGLEVAAGDRPLAWYPDTWGSSTSTFTYVAGGAHGGERSVRVDVVGRADGDSKWVPDLVPVTGGSYYVYSDWYRSDVTTAVSVYYETDLGERRWANLFAGIAPAAEWAQYRTGFTMPARAVRARFVHFIELDGFLQTDDHSMKEVDAPPGFSRPMVSLTFDDGSQAFYDVARPMLDAKGFKTTQYIPTLGLGTDPFLMTHGEVKQLAEAGHEIGSHSVRHPHMRTLADEQLDQELQDSETLLRAITERDVVSFAYPFGEYDARVIEAARAAGFTSGRSVEEGYNSTLDLERFDLRVQNVTADTDLATFRSWVDYAAARRYWLILVYHEVVPDGTLPGPFDTTAGRFRDQLDHLVAAGLAGDVLTVRAALAVADAEVHPAPGSVDPGTPAAVSTDPVAQPSPAADRTAPKIEVVRPKARRYRLGRTLTIRFSCFDVSGIAAQRATLHRRGSRTTRVVKTGSRLRLRRRGRYALRVTATDRAGNRATRTVIFRVSRR
jgi:peptidoglycan/xylan/chitin deacetylase (PgdA/CDA1 family)